MTINTLISRPKGPTSLFFAILTITLVYLNTLVLNPKNTSLSTKLSQINPIPMSTLSMFLIQLKLKKYLNKLFLFNAQAFVIEADYAGVLSINSLSTNFIFLKLQSLVQIKREEWKRLVV